MTTSQPTPAPPGSQSETLLTDGGLETTLIFHDGIDLPEFASFPLVETDDGRAALLSSPRGSPWVRRSSRWRLRPTGRRRRTV